jgi:leader peptidase (prepilin peptidase)/N-methyltransferase
VDPFFAIVIFLLGLCFGSFANVCIYRLPRALSVVRPRSACPRCGAPIAGYDNIPVFSWLALGGRCRACKTPISPRYLAVELLVGLLFVACYARFDLTLLTLKYGVLAFLLVVLIFTDAETKLLPDALTLPGLALGVLFSLLVPVDDLATRLLPGLLPLPGNPALAWRALSLADALLGAALGASFIYGAGMIYKIARHVEGMGFGDVKLMALIGAFLGPRLTVFTLFAASLAGSLYGLGIIPVVWLKRKRRYARRAASAEAARARAWQSAKKLYRHHGIPFGVHLGAMALLAFFFGNTILRWYWGFGL